MEVFSISTSAFTWNAAYLSLITIGSSIFIVASSYRQPRDSNTIEGRSVGVFGIFQANSHTHAHTHTHSPAHVSVLTTSHNGLVEDVGNY